MTCATPMPMTSSATRPMAIGLPSLLGRRSGGSGASASTTFCFFLFLLAKAVEVGEQRIGEIILLRRRLCGRFRRGLGGCLRRRRGGGLRGLFLRLGLEPLLLAFLARTAALGLLGGLASRFLF